MKNQIVKVVTSLSFFALLCASAHAQAAHQPLRAHVPFDFAAGRDEMPAGDYEIRLVDTTTNLQIVQIISAGGHTSRFLQMTCVEGGKVREGGRLVLTGLEPMVWGARWFDPRRGDELDLGPITPDANRSWRAPAPPSHDDWVLVLVAR